MESGFGVKWRADKISASWSLRSLLSQKANAMSPFLQLLRFRYKLSCQGLVGWVRRNIVG